MISGEFNTQGELIFVVDAEGRQVGTRPTLYAPYWRLD